MIVEYVNLVNKLKLKKEFLWRVNDVIRIIDEYVLRFDREFFIQKLRREKVLEEYRGNEVERILRMICQFVKIRIKVIFGYRLIDFDINYEFTDNGVLFKLDVIGIRPKNLHPLYHELRRLKRELYLLDDELAKKVAVILSEFQMIMNEIEQRKEELSKKAKEVW